MTVTSATSPGTQWAGPTARPTTMGQSDFIRLMTEQMKMQDPLEPVDNKEMIAQMAQFSSLAGINDINATLKAIAAQLDKAIAATATNSAAAPAAAVNTTDPTNPAATA